MNSTNKLTGKEIAVVIAALIIGVAGVACMGYGISMINEHNSTPSWVTNDVDELKANADADYHKQMAKYTKSPSVEEVQKDVEAIVSMYSGESVVKIKTDTYELKIAGSVIEVKTAAYHYKEAGSVIKIETNAYEYKKAGSVVKMEYK